MYLWLLFAIFILRFSTWMLIISEIIILNIFLFTYKMYNLHKSGNIDLLILHKYKWQYWANLIYLYSIWRRQIKRQNVQIILTFCITYRCYVTLWKTLPHLYSYIMQWNRMLDHINPISITCLIELSVWNDFYITHGTDLLQFCTEELSCELA